MRVYPDEDYEAQVQNQSRELDASLAEVRWEKEINSFFISPNRTPSKNAEPHCFSVKQINPCFVLFKNRCMESNVLGKFG